MKVSIPAYIAKKAAEAGVAVAVTGMGMLGLYSGIEYSGWVLFVGLLVAFGVGW